MEETYRDIVTTVVLVFSDFRLTEPNTYRWDEVSVTVIVLRDEPWVSQQGVDNDT